MGFFSKSDDSEIGGASWHIESKSDPRWNRGGYAYGMWHAQDEIQKAVEAAKPTLGEPPADLEYGYNKP